MTYKEQLKSPKWQKKRLEIMQRDGFQCQCCLSIDKTLTVHHKKYIKDKMAWEYEDKFLITLCEDCHSGVHECEKIDSGIVFNLIKHSLSYTDYYILGRRIFDILNEQEIERGYKTIIELLISQTIKKDNI